MSEPSTIACLYTCDACGIKDQTVDVPERDPATHDVIQWFEGIAIPCVVLDHHARSPLCRPKKLTSIGIPFEEGSEHVGTRVRS